MRIQHSIKNIISNFGFILTKSILGFVSRTVFISTLGSTYLGVNGLLTNILLMLSLAELGIGTAINFSLYKPIAENDNEKVSMLMTLYKKSYRIIGVVVLIIGLVIMLFLDLIIKDGNGIQNLRFIFLLYLINTVLSYFVSYKETLINADQKGYKIVSYNTFFTTLLTMIQMIVLLIFKSFIYYLITQIAISFIQRLFINRYITKQYNYINFSNKNPIPKRELNTIKKNVKAMVFHKIGDYCINGTDNIIISAFISISEVGIYSNYVLIISMINQFVMIAFNSITASLGNLVAKEDEEKRIEIFNVINFIGFWILGFSAVCFYNLLNPFVTLWIGNEFLIKNITVVVLVLNFYVTGMRIPVAVVKSAAGLYDEDKYTPIIQSLINLVFSIVLVKTYGLTGVLLGTLISSIALPSWQRPMIVYKYVFKKSSKEYFKNYFIYGVLVFINAVFTSFIIQFLCPKYTIQDFILKILICILVFNLGIVILFFKAKEFKYIKKLLGGFRVG